MVSVLMVGEIRRLERTNSSIWQIRFERTA